MASSDDEYDWDQPPLTQQQAGSLPPIPSSVRENPQSEVRTVPPLHMRGVYNEAWVKELHEKIQAEIAREGIEACTWARLLERWRLHIRDVPYERVAVACAKQILQHARLTSASASPMFYETLRRYAYVDVPAVCRHICLYMCVYRLGQDVLTKPEEVDQRLLDALYPGDDDSKYYRGFFGERVRLSVHACTAFILLLYLHTTFLIYKVTVPMYADRTSGRLSTLRAT